MLPFNIEFYLKSDIGSSVYRNYGIYKIDAFKAVRDFKAALSAEEQKQFQRMIEYYYGTLSNFFHHLNADGNLWCSQIRLQKFLQYGNLLKYVPLFTIYSLK